MAGSVVAVSKSNKHEFSKQGVGSIRLLAGLGIEGDAHLGVNVQHMARVREDPNRPNLRQVHLIHRELFDELKGKGFEIGPGELGENVTTSGIALLGLPVGTRLHLGQSAVVEVTGLRNPCRQIQAHKAGLLAAVLDKDAAGNVIRKTGIMSIVLAGGVVAAGDRIEVEFPAEPHRAMGVV